MSPRFPIRRSANPRASGAAVPSQFAQTYAPLLWTAEVDMFGVTVDYTPVGSGVPIQITGLWKEGAEDEPTSPGRYSIFQVQNSDIPGGPSYGDLVHESTQGTFIVSHIGPDANGYSRLTLRENA